MKTLITILTVYFILASMLLKAGVKEIPFTLDDRDRLIRTEQNVEALKAEMIARFDGVNSRFESVNSRFESINSRFESVNSRFEAMDKRFDQLFNFLWAIIGIFTTMVISVFGFAFWDRKLSLAPMKNENRRILSVLSDYAKTQPKLLEIMKNAGLM